MEAPDGGPNFYEFGDDVLYAINIDNDGDGMADIIYQFQFTSVITNPNTFLYNTGPITRLTSPTWNRRQTYSVTRVDQRRTTVLGHRHPVPAVQHRTALHPGLPGWSPRPSPARRRGTKVFAGQRAEGFYVDLGAVFDLGTSGRSSRTTPPSGCPAPGSARWPPGSTRPTGSTSTASPSRSRSTS